MPHITITLMRKKNMNMTMKNKYAFLVFDLGATSGRSILATIKKGVIKFVNLHPQ